MLRCVSHPVSKLRSLRSFALLARSFAEDFIIIPLPLWIDIFCPIFAAVYGLFVGWLGAFLLTVCAWRSLEANYLMNRVVDDTWEDKIPRNTDEERRLADNLQHLVMMCGYKEPMEATQMKFPCQAKTEDEFGRLSLGR